MDTKDPVMVDLDRYLTTLEEGYQDPYDRKQARDEYIADQMEQEDE